MKKVLATFLAAAMLLTLAACGSAAPSSSAAGSAPASSSEASDFQSNILFCGSTSLYPIISSLASSFTDQ